MASVRPLAVLFLCACGVLGGALLASAALQPEARLPGFALGFVLGGSTGAIALLFLVLGWRAFHPPAPVPLEDGESVVADMAANHWLGLEARGGRLKVTDRRLIFEPHRFNVQVDAAVAALADVAEVTIPVTGQVSVVLRDGTRHTFVVALPGNADGTEMIAMLLANAARGRRNVG